MCMHTTSETIKFDISILLIKVERNFKIQLVRSHNASKVRRRSRRRCISACVEFNSAGAWL